MRCVIIETPYAGTPAEVEINERYARACMRDSLQRGEAPMLSHLLYTQVLDDRSATERRVGMEAGWSWLARADASVVYSDLGISPGMARGVERALMHDVPTETRSLGESWDK